MKQAEWDTLRNGDGVLLHVDGAAELVQGVIAIVTPAKGTGDANEVAVRIEDADESYYMWPAPADVHTDPRDVTEACAQCGLVRL